MYCKWSLSVSLYDLALLCVCYMQCLCRTYCVCVTMVLYCTVCVRGIQYNSVSIIQCCGPYVCAGSIGRHSNKAVLR